MCDSIAAWAKWTNSMLMKQLRKDVEGICDSFGGSRVKIGSELWPGEFFQKNFWTKCPCYGLCMSIYGLEQILDGYVWNFSG